MQINICFSSDNNYAPYLAVSIVSILKNATGEDNYNFYILDGGITDKNKKKINSLKKIKDFNLEFINVNADDFSDCSTKGKFADYITLPAYYRFKISSFIPEVDKILYLDCDLVVDSDIKELFQIDIEKYYIGAVPEPGNDFYKIRCEIDGDEYYCNSGVVLINSRKWRENNVEQQLFDYVKNPKRELYCHDQDVINEVLKYKIKYLPLAWNVMHNTVMDEVEPYPYHVEQRIEALKRPKLIHFTHKNKPWSHKCINKLRKTYYKYFKMSPYKELYYLMRVRKLFRTVFSRKR